MKKLYSFIGKYKKEQIFIFMICALGILISMLFPYRLAKLINVIQTRESWQVIMWQLTLLFVLAVFSAILNFFQNYFWHRFRLRFINHVRMEVFQATLKKKLCYFKENNSGNILSKILQETVLPAEHIAIGIPILILNLFRVCGVLIFIYFLDPLLCSIVSLTIVVYFLLFRKMYQQLQENAKKSMQAYSELSGEIQQEISGISVIRFFQKENYFIDRVHQKMTDFEKVSIKNALFKALGYGVIGLIKDLLPIVVLGLGGWLIYQEQLMLGSLIGVYFYLNYLYEPLNNLGTWVIEANQALGVGNQVLTFMESDLETENKNGYNLSGIDKIEFCDVSFSYNGKDLVLNKLNFSVERGECLGILGPSGIGKSSIFALLMKMYDVTEGEIQINGLPVSKISNSYLYQYITYAEQDLIIFSGTVSENIMLEKRRDIPISALKLSDAENVIGELPQGKQAVLTERGNNISGGQKQRISLCRTLAKECDVILLDEITSSLDKNSSEKIMKNITVWGKENNKIILFISHDPSDFRYCDKVVQL